jgi:hypothetical protein
MKKFLFGIVMAGMCAAAPVLTDLQPRGVQKGRPFKLTVVGRGLGEGARIQSTLAATFTPLGPDKPAEEGRTASFLVEPTGDPQPGVYPIRVETPDGISNVQLFVVGTFPEYTEDESRPGALPNSNDTIESAQALPSGPLVLNGALKGPERDVFRLSAKAGEKRVLEVEARRCGSAIDPVIEVQDASGKTIARSEDAPLLGLDARVDVTFPRDGYYYAVVHDARYSTQMANFYRLKIGSYSYPQEVFPLGGRRGEVVSVSLGGSQSTSADLRHVSATVKQVFVNIPESPVLPLPFAVGDDPEVIEPSGELAAPITINGRLRKPGAIARYTVKAKPGDPLAIRIEAIELGTSKLMAVITAFDEKGNQLGRAGDEPLGEDVYNVNQSRTAGDPSLMIIAPGSAVTIAVEDLALRGGLNYGYRLNIRSVAQDFRAALAKPFVNVPLGGSVTVPVGVERRGFDGEIRLRIPNAPKGLRVEGGFVLSRVAIKGEENRNRTSIGVLVLTADAEISTSGLVIEAVGKLADGTELVRRAEGPGMMVAVAGATQQGSVDRQRPVTAPWLAMDLPVAATKAQPATLEVSLLERKRMEEGDQIKFRWKWTAREPGLSFPAGVNADLVGAADIRIIDAKADGEGNASGTFLITTTKLTRPATYDLYISGRVMQEEVVSRPIPVEVKEVGSAHVAETVSNH